LLTAGGTCAMIGTSPLVGLSLSSAAFFGGLACFFFFRGLRLFDMVKTYCKQSK
jgi:hypothetical protein